MPRREDRTLEEAQAVAARRATAWTEGRIIAKDLPSASTVRLLMHVEHREPHRPGQHYLIRLRAEDGYTAQRPYSVASADDDDLLEFLIERQPDGEVSEFLLEVAEVGDVLELRGPIGRWFTWDARTPALCLVGGTGVVPAVAMGRTAKHLHRPDLVRIAAMGRSRRELPYVDELTRLGAALAFTREQVADRPAGAFTAEEVEALARGAETFYVCGSARFASYAEALLLGLGVDPPSIRVERFGPAAG